MHRTGFLKQFINSAIELVVEGMTFADLERYGNERPSDSKPKHERNVCGEAESQQKTVRGVL